MKVVWLLLYISVNPIYAEVLSEHKTMTECFKARELVVNLRSQPPQYTCLKTKKRKEPVS
jgi:hypothetical protein